MTNFKENLSIYKAYINLFFLHKTIYFLYLNLNWNQLIYEKRS